jgi:hypothetical protein
MQSLRQILKIQTTVANYTIPISPFFLLDYGLLIMLVSFILDTNFEVYFLYLSLISNLFRCSHCSWVVGFLRSLNYAQLFGYLNVVSAFAVVVFILSQPSSRFIVMLFSS